MRYRHVPPSPGTVVRELDVGGIPLLLADFEGSIAVESVAGEMGDGAYDFSGIDFPPGSVVVDIGAHVGVVSIYLAKTHPHVTVHSYEPTPPTFALLRENLRRNRVRNVVTHNCAVSGERGELDLVAHLTSNSGGSTSSFSTLDLAGHQRWTVPAITLDDVFAEVSDRTIALLKIDIEGAEHDVLRNASSLDRIQVLRGEFHENSYLRSKGHTIEGLREFCAANLRSGDFDYIACPIPDV
jgi:FkbM family methyltransferase